MTLTGNTFSGGIISPSCTLDPEAGTWSNLDDSANMTGNIVGPLGGDNPVTAFTISSVVDTSQPGSPGVFVF